MRIIVVWYFISYGANAGIHWSPPMATEQECERVRSEVYKDGNWTRRGSCIRVSEVVK